MEELLRVDEVRWIRDHQIASDVIFPAAGYVAMAGEAARQLTGTPDFTVRRVIVNAAFVIGESASVEVVTSLKQLRLTDTLDSAWYEFTISSYNGSSWTKHCTGQVCAGKQFDLKAVEPRGKLPKSVSSDRWYRIHAGGQVVLRPEIPATARHIDWDGRHSCKSNNAQ